jgi:hypothetical protein
MNEGLMLSAQVEGVQTRRDGTLKITLGCQEMSQSKAGELLTMQNKVCAVYISQKETVSQAVMDMVDQADADLPGKTKSQRMRNVLYRIWEMDREGHKTFESYYAYRMERMISDLKQHLEQLTT